MLHNLVNINISEVALRHFADLISKEDLPGMSLRIFLDRPGQPNAEIGISFCPPGEHKATDTILDYDLFKLYVDKPSLVFLEDASINYKEDAFGGQLAISAPKLKAHKPDNAASLGERVTYVLTTEVNPNLAHHGGMVSLIEVTPENVVVLQFGGGCHGCGMADVTLKHGIEKTLKEYFPEITAIRDITDHSSGDNPYYAKEEG